MIKQLKFRINLIFTIATFFIVTIMSIFILSLYESKLNERTTTNLHTIIKNIHYHLQTNVSISQEWLRELESSNSLIISIEQNSHSLLFSGVFPTVSNREELLNSVKTIARTEYNFSFYPKYQTDENTLTFDYMSNNKEHFLVSVSTLRLSSSYCTLIILKDLSSEDWMLTQIHLLFACALIVCLILLFIVSLLLSEIVTKPIKENNQKQLDFIAAASHELRSPLAVIQTSTDSLSQSSSELRGHFINLIKNECQRMGRLINDLLFLASSDSKSLPLRKGLVEIDTLLLNIYDYYLPLIEKSNKTLNLLLPDVLIPQVNVDKDYLQQAITILLDNAISHTPSNTHIELILTQTHQGLSITIQDNGTGIPDHLKTQVFDKFFCVDTSHHNKQHYGLGLSIAREIVHLHKGSLTLQDAPLGGCRFTIFLPL